MLRRLRTVLAPKGLAPETRYAVNTLRAVTAVLLVVVVLLAQRSLTESRRVDQQVRRTVAVTCTFYRDLAAADSTVNERTGELGVKLLADARRIHQGLRCGPLPPPAAALKRAAAKFHVDLE